MASPNTIPNSPTPGEKANAPLRVVNGPTSSALLDQSPETSKSTSNKAVVNESEPDTTLSRKSKATFLRLPDFTTPPPPTGPLTLGSIIFDPSGPLVSVNKDLIIPVPESSITTHYTSGYERLYENTCPKSGLFSFLSFGAGSTTSGNNSTTVSILEFDKLETTTFEPSIEYIWKVISAGNMKKKTRYRSWLYLVTGLKIVRGQSVLHKVTTENVSEAVRAGNLVPVSGGSASVQAAGMHGRNNGSEVVRSSTDFVLAMRLSVIRFERKLFSSKEGEMVVEEYTTGATL